jgi:hypothetical protein
MIYRHALYDEVDGWVHSVRMVEGPALPPGEPAAPLSEAEHAAAATHPGLRHGPDGLELAQDDRVAWQVFRQRGADGPRAVERLDDARAARAVFARDLTVAVATPAPVHEPSAPLGAVYPIAGLTLDAMTAAHLDDAATIAIAANLYPATCPDGRCQPPEAHAWLALAARLDHPDQWQTVLSYQGQPLQYEVITLSPDRTAAVFSITYHTARGRQRPAWFHREVEQPVFAALRQLGVRRLESRTRADRPDWIQSLKANYGATELATRGGITRLDFPLDPPFTGWPARKALGFDQTVGRLRVWEATAGDLPALRQLLLAIPAGRRALAAQLLEERWALDRATILLGAVDGTLKHARAIRLRGGTRAGLSNLSALAEPDQEALPGLLFVWCQQAGYTELGTYVPTRLLTQADQAADLQRLGATAKPGGERTFDGEPHAELLVSIPAP